MPRPSTYTCRRPPGDFGVINELARAFDPPWSFQRADRFATHHKITRDLGPGGRAVVWDDVEAILGLGTGVPREATADQGSDAGLGLHASPGPCRPPAVSGSRCSSHPRPATPSGPCP